MDHGAGRRGLHRERSRGGILIAAPASRARSPWPTRPFFDLDPGSARLAFARTVIISAPYEGTVSYGRGAAAAPRAILEASWQVELFDQELGREPKLALSSIPPLSLPRAPAQALARVEKAVSKILRQGKRPLLLGGEHSLSLGALRPAQRLFPRLTVLQLDAHADLRDQWEGTPFSHACVMRRAAEMGLTIVPVGIRSLSLEESQWIKRHRQKVFWAEEIRGKAGWVREVIRRLGPEVYLTIDIDVLDPSEMPSTGTPEPAGLSFHDLLALFRALAASRKKVVGLDLVELAPIPRLHAPEFLCARLLYFLLARLDP